jgi:CMP-N,N'-diacetyllegionaminic acid synthase
VNAASINVIAVVPARGGSKAIPRKNLVKLAGKPLIAHTLDAARAAHSLQRIIVSTDDEEIAAVCKEMGAEVPFLRPAHLSDDAAPMHGVLLHALEWQEKYNGKVEAVVLLQPTSPLRTAKHIDDAVTLFFKTHASSVVSVVEVPHSFNPVSVMKVEEGALQPFLPDVPLITRRQDKPKVYARNGPAVLVCAPETLRSGELYGEKCVPYMMHAGESLDIDERADLDYAEWILKKNHES